MDPKFAEALSKFAANDPEEYKKYSQGPFLTLNKRAAARRQLNTAIWLWFNEGDSASIHTLTGAAFGILRDLYYREKKRHPAPFDEVVPELRDHAKNVRNLMTQTEWFLKHARQDADESYSISVQFTEHYLFNAINAYIELKGEPDQSLMNLFIIRFSVIHPHIFGGTDAVRPAFQESWNIEAFKDLSRIEFFRKFGGPDRDFPPERHQF